MNNPATFYMVRHGQTEWNVQGLVQGSTSDSALTDEGKRVAKELGTKFSNINFDLVYSSDQLRAKRTAEIIILEKKLAIETTELLRERSFGEFEGRPNTELNKVKEIIEKLVDAERYVYKHSDAYESDEQLTNRFLTFIREVATANPGKTILLVTHGSFMRLALIKLGFGDYKSLAPGTVDNGGWVKFESDGTDFLIKEYEGIWKKE